MSGTGMTTQIVLEAIAEERARLLASIDALGDRATSLAVTEEGWTAKDVLAHCIHWATQIAFGMGAQVEPPPYMLAERERRKAAGLPDTMPTADESNALVVAHYAGASLAEVRAKFDAVVDALVDRIRLRSDAEINEANVVAWAPGRPLWQLIGGETFLHWPAHTEAIERASATA